MNKLPKLPEPAILLTVDLPMVKGGAVRRQPFYTADQMHAYASAAIGALPHPATGPLRRGVTGVCSKKDSQFGCTCEREGLGDQCIWLSPMPAA
jgi:hypothetical protein